MRAIVFSGGGLWGAYHVGAWKVLSRCYQPDLVVGVSIGSLFGYLVACGYPVEEMEREWLSGERYSPPRLRIPRSLLGGWLAPESVHGLMREMTKKLKPKTRFATVALSVPRLKPVIFESPGITWQHLAASCAVPFIYDAQRINGTLFTDGGLIRACPVDVAQQLGADEIIGLDCVSGGSRRVDDKAYIIGTRKYLGTPHSAFVWKRSNIERWIAAGERDATEALASGAVCSGPATFA